MVTQEKRRIVEVSFLRFYGDLKKMEGFVKTYEKKERNILESSCFEIHNSIVTSFLTQNWD